MTIPVGFSQVNFVFSGLAVPNNAEVTFGVANTSALSPADIASGIALGTALAALMAEFTDEVAITTIKVKNGPDATGPSAEIGVNIAGADPGSNTNPNVAALIEKQTALGGRRGRGRMFFPGVPNQDVDSDGDLTTAFRDGVQIDASAWLTELSTGSIPMVLLHDPGLSFEPAPTTVTALTVDSVSATQRRRLRR